MPQFCAFWWNFFNHISELYVTFWHFLHYLGLITITTIIIKNIITIIIIIIIVVIIIVIAFLPPSGANCVWCTLGGWSATFRTLDWSHFNINLTSRSERCFTLLRIYGKSCLFFQTLVLFKSYCSNIWTEPRCTLFLHQVLILESQPSYEESLSKNVHRIFFSPHFGNYYFKAKFTYFTCQIGQTDCRDDIH